MKKKRYKFNPQTLTYEVISIPFRIRFYRILRKILIGFILASIVNLLFSFFFYTPKMYHIEEQNNELLLKYDILNDKIHAATVKLQELRHRDNNVYRPLFAADSLTIQGVYTEYPDVKYSDMQGDLYEYMLSKLSTAGQNGQFRTPKHIREMMVELAAPTPDDTICDPACGTAGFLVSAAEYIRSRYENEMTAGQWERFDGPMFTGFDTDRTMLRISAMNLMLHSVTRPEIDYRDSVSKQNAISDKFTLCLANPPFKGTVDAESISDSLRAAAGTKKTELLFVALFLRMLVKGGRCACIVPDGVLFGSSKAHISLRRELVENHRLSAVVSMPSGVFKPYSGVSTAVLVFTKTGAGGTDDVWFYDMKADGYTLDDKRAPTDENDIPDIIERFRSLDKEAARARTERSFLVPKEEIAANGYDLTVNKYRKVEYAPVEYPPTEQIIAELHELEMEITAGLAELEEML